jgi:hypothetical protein
MIKRSGSVSNKNSYEKGKKFSINLNSGTDFTLGT